MSRPRKRKHLCWTDESGNAFVDSWRVKPAPSLAAIPHARRLVNVIDPADHLVGVVVDGGDAPPILIARGSGPSTMMMVLDGERLVGAMRWLADDGTEMVGTLGKPEPGSLPMRCHSCRFSYVVMGTDLQAALARRSSRRPTPGARARRVS